MPTASQSGLTISIHTPNSVFERSAVAAAAMMSSRSIASYCMRIVLGMP